MELLSMELKFNVMIKHRDYVDLELAGICLHALSS